MDPYVVPSIIVQPSDIMAVGSGTLRFGTGLCGDNNYQSHQVHSLGSRGHIHSLEIQPFIDCETKQVTSPGPHLYLLLSSTGFNNAHGLIYFTDQPPACPTNLP